MSIEWLRDLVIVVFGLVATAVLVFLAILSYSCYRRIKPILHSVKVTSETIEQLTSYAAQEVAKPLMQAGILIQGIRAGIEVIGRLFKKKQ